MSVMVNTTIENKELLEITENLKVQYPAWASRVAEYISKEKDWKNYSNNACTENNVYHISSGKIKSQLHRRLFMKGATKLLIGAAESSREVESLVNQTK